MSTITDSQIRTASQRGHAGAHQPTYRLTRRGRLVVLVLGLVVLLGGMVLVASGSMASDDAGGDVATETVLVAPGDSLWSIASAASEGDDVRDMMVRIEQLNGLEGGQVAAGDSLYVPVE